MFSSGPTVKKIAMTTCFAALYPIFYSLPMFPIIGLSGAAITAAAVMAPVTGILLGPFLGSLSTVLGGIIVLFLLEHFSLMSLIATAVATFCAGLLYIGKRKICCLIYFTLLIFFGFYPPVGPFWIYPLLTWFQIIGLLILASPISSIAVKKLQSLGNGKSSFLFFFVISLLATLAGQIAGSLTFEIVFWPTFISEIEVWITTWKVIAWTYPVERIIIAAASTLIGIPLLKTLRSTRLI